MRIVFSTAARSLGVVLLVSAALPGCAETGAAGSNESDGSLEIRTAFYPLQFVTERVAGPAADVRNLTKAGAEPHDLELGPREVADLGSADLVVYLSGFQPAVDTAVAQEAAASAYDVADAARLDLGSDPHFWLDPTRLADVADAVAGRLGEVDPGRAGEFRRNAEGLRRDLLGLDRDLSEGLGDCESRDLVTSHTAFGYLAQRYRLDQHGITGISPDSEPTSGDLAEVADFVRTHAVRTIYHEPLVSSDVAATVAKETGARMASLDPVEGLDDSSAGGDYIEVMRANLATLREGQPCRTR